LGSYVLHTPAGAATGAFAATKESETATRLEIELDGGGPLNAWGIYDQDVCGAPPPDHDAPFQFADIEGGRRTEEVETAAFLSFPGRLMVLVFGSSGGVPIACADLGPAVARATPSSETARCDETPPPQPPGATDDLPDRSRIAFSKEALANADVFTMASDGTDVRRLTTAVGLDIKPSWSPDGRQIAFRSTRDGHDQIYVMNADGTCQRRLTTGVDDRSPAWSPDGCSIAFDHFFDESHQDIAVISPGGGSIRRVTTLSGEYAAWSPDGGRLAFASARDGDYDIYVINADGTDEQQLTQAASYEMYPAWSPDGQRLVYESNAGSSALEIHAMAVDGTHDERLTNDDRVDRFPAWSIDGRLAWSAEGTIVVADGVRDPPRAVGSGQFPAWQAWTSGPERIDC
jgi:dipeptidyl aminopeptidase/acylaminoacyl peptidase